PVEDKLQQGLKKRLTPANYLQLVDEGNAKGVLDAREAAFLKETYAVVRDAIDVDEFGDLRSA
ncbi:MAG: acyl-CoA dehydrogenase domain-containing protein, partial [Gammaproteobacteria bacterium]